MPERGHLWQWAEDRNVQVHRLSKTEAAIHRLPALPCETASSRPDAPEPSRDRLAELHGLHLPARGDALQMDDPALLEAVLGHANGHLTGDDICDVLEWSEARYNHTLQLVAYRLESTGLRLVQAGWDSYAILSRLHPYDEPLGRTRWLERSITTQAGLTPVEAQQLYWLTPTADAWRRDLTQEQRRARQRLEQQGLLVEEPAGLMISAAVSHSLRLPIELEGEFNAIHR